MRTFKVIIGFLLLFGMATAYVQASIDMGSFFSPAIIAAAFTMLVFSTWLIGSGFSVRKFRFKSFEFVRFFIISFTIFIIATMFGYRKNASPTNFVHVNGLDIPLGTCIRGHKLLIPDKAEREKYCKCIVEKLTDDDSLKLKYQKQLLENKIVAVIKEMEASPDFLGIDVKECTGFIHVEWNDHIANAMKERFKNQLVGTEFEETNDIDHYCDCLLDEYQKIPLNTIANEGFYESTEALEIDDKCIEKSKK